MQKADAHRNLLDRHGSAENPRSLEAAGQRRDNDLNGRSAARTRDGAEKKWIRRETDVSRAEEETHGGHLPGNGDERM